jgi:hypothetical protein
MSINFHLIARNLVQFKELQMSNSSCPFALAIAIVTKNANFYLYGEGFYQDKETFKQIEKFMYFFYFFKPCTKKTNLYKNSPYKKLPYTKLPIKNKHKNNPIQNYPLQNYQKIITLQKITLQKITL